MTNIINRDGKLTIYIDDNGDIHTLLNGKEIRLNAEFLDCAKLPAKYAKFSAAIKNNGATHLLDGWADRNGNQFGIFCLYAGEVDAITTARNNHPLVIARKAAITAEIQNARQAELAWNTDTAWRKQHGCGERNECGNRSDNTIYAPSDM